MIGGNTQAKLQKRTAGEKNVLGESEHTWAPVADLLGWLDYTGEVSEYEKYKTKLAESTHVFICDYQVLEAADPHDLRMAIGGVEFDVLYIDDPMALHEQLEFYLKKVG
ncbi:hypothetical protein SAMN04515656_104142 [Eubacterium aggregans]|uniref:Phage head-tail adaptor, putative, SPP1 family n=1 Tax=Eubacterium aggregans TaxID=81409 RepID=A0A1H3YWP5_9FIRM|nr:head-tail adaptor protein [Eubacterium aggregans]SEA15837.1 hypothetical protein SAMN04515656_104142 [Eubacterium aggregans]